MNIPSWIYRSERIGRNGRRFSLYKFRTLKEDFFGNYATEQGYTKFGRFLRKTKLDELPQILNWIKRDINIVGPRPELPETIDLIPKDIRKIILSKRPGLTSLASIHFADEEFLLQQSKDSAVDYYEKVKPMKLLLDVFYVQNKSFLLDLWIIWRTILIVFRGLTK